MTNYTTQEANKEYYSYDGGGCDMKDFFNEITEPHRTKESELETIEE